jgi:pSer/pThr/pTyr-binding forkhead associated (FHA) protein
MWILETDDPSATPHKFRLPAGSVKTIGRSTGAEFIVDVALVSRLHCQLTASPDSLDVKDLGSTNGTFVNGRRVRAAQLKDGDRLRVGRCELVVRMGSGKKSR